MTFCGHSPRSQSLPELPLRPRRVPPNQPGSSSLLAQGVGPGASQQMPPSRLLPLSVPTGAPPVCLPLPSQLCPPGHWGLA